MAIFFTSDGHFDHKNVIKYCNRPFIGRYTGELDVQTMNWKMIMNWNTVVTPNDTVFYLGDFSLCNLQKVRQFRSNLEGRIVLIRGNHDLSTKKLLAAGFDEVYNSLELELDGLKLFLRHIPPQNELQDSRVYKKEFLDDPPSFYNYWLNGHVHERWRRRGKCINVGVDQWDYQPITLTKALSARDEDEVL